LGGGFPFKEATFVGGKFPNRFLTGPLVPGHRHPCQLRHPTCDGLSGDPRTRQVGPGRPALLPLALALKRPPIGYNKWERKIMGI